MPLVEGRKIVPEKRRRKPGPWDEPWVNPAHYERETIWETGFRTKFRWIRLTEDNGDPAWFYLDPDHYPIYYPEISR